MDICQTVRIKTDSINCFEKLKAFTLVALLSGKPLADFSHMMIVCDILERAEEAVGRGSPPPSSGMLGHIVTQMVDGSLHCAVSI